MGLGLEFRFFFSRFFFCLLYNIWVVWASRSTSKDMSGGSKMAKRKAVDLCLVSKELVFLKDKKTPLIFFFSLRFPSRSSWP